MFVSMQWGSGWEGASPCLPYRATVGTTYTDGCDCPLQIIQCEVLCVEQEQRLESEHSGSSPPSAPAVTSAHPRTSVSPSDKWGRSTFRETLMFPVLQEQNKS